MADGNPHLKARRKTPVTLITIGAVFFVLSAVSIRAYEQHQIEKLANSCSQAVAQFPVADVVRAIQTLKLVTCEIDTQVRVDRGDENWRGIVKASVVTPVRMRYGVNLETMELHSIRFSPISDDGSGVCIVSVEYPQLLGTEIFSERERIDVDAEGLRLRSIGGEYYLGLARRDVADAARKLTLRPDDETRMREITAEQLKALIAKMIGKDVTVVVRFVGGQS